MKIKLGSIPFIYPIPIILAGPNVAGKPNFATLGDCGVMGINPPLVFVSLHREHYTTSGIMENKTFSINIPTTSMLAITDYCGIHSGKQVNKSELFEVFYGELGTAPMIQECHVNLECRVIKEVSIEHRQIYIGKVEQTYVDEGLATKTESGWSFEDLTKFDPIIYGLDNRYYRLGVTIGIGYKEGRKHKQ